MQSKEVRLFRLPQASRSNLPTHASVVDASRTYDQDVAGMSRERNRRSREEDTDNRGSGQPARHPARLTDLSELLAPVYGWFTEGFDTRDLKEPTRVWGCPTTAMWVYRLGPRARQAHAVHRR
jgi:hypothetical protein